MSYGKNKAETIAIMEETSDAMINSPIFTS